MADEPERFVVAAPNCSATALPGHGHRIHQQSPASLADDLRTFLNGRGL